MVGPDCRDGGEEVLGAGGEVGQQDGVVGDHASVGDGEEGEIGCKSDIPPGSWPGRGW